MVKHVIAPASQDDARRIGPLLRSEDLREITAASGECPCCVLVRCVTQWTWIWTADDKDVALFGIYQLDKTTAIPWLVATDEFQHYPAYFLRNCKSIVGCWNQTWPLLTNCVDARNTLHIKFLKWAGFTFTELIPDWGAAKLPFWRFERRSNYV